MRFPSHHYVAPKAEPFCCFHSLPTQMGTSGKREETSMSRVISITSVPVDRVEPPLSGVPAIANALRLTTIGSHHHSDTTGGLGTSSPKNGGTRFRDGPEPLDSDAVERLARLVYFLVSLLWLGGPK